MNYLTAIDDEIARLRQRIAELETARQVLLTFKDLPAPPAAKPKPKAKRRPRVLGALQKARKWSLEYLGKQTEPKSSRDIILALTPHELSDSTIWKGLKEMRDEGLITWDETSRFYSVVRRSKILPSPDIADLRGTAS